MGQVFDPSGQVPLYNALVYVPNGEVKPFQQGVTCDRCGSTTTGDPLVTALTDATGSYTLRSERTTSVSTSATPSGSSKALNAGEIVNVAIKPPAMAYP